MAWSQLHSASDANVTTAPVNQTAGPGFDRRMGRVRYWFSVLNTAVLGTAVVNFTYTDRGGVPRSHTSGMLSLLSPGVVTGDFNFYLEDAPTAGIDFTLTVLGVVGSYKLSYWWEIQGEQGA